MMIIMVHSGIAQFFDLFFYSQPYPAASYSNYGPYVSFPLVLVLAKALRRLKSFSTNESNLRAISLPFRHHSLLSNR